MHCIVRSGSPVLFHRHQLAEFFGLPLPRDERINSEGNGQCPEHNG